MGSTGVLRRRAVLQPQERGIEPPTTPVSAATARSVRKHRESHGMPLGASSELRRTGSFSDDSSRWSRKFRPARLRHNHNRRTRPSFENKTSCRPGPATSSGRTPRHGSGLHAEGRNLDSFVATGSSIPLVRVCNSGWFSSLPSSPRENAADSDKYLTKMSSSWPWRQSSTNR